MENCFFWHIGPVLAADATYKVKPTVAFVSYYDQFTNDLNLPTWAGISQMQKKGMYLSRLADCAPRTHRIFEIVFKAWQKKRDALVLSDRKEILRQIHVKLLNAGVPKEDIGYYVHGKKDATRPVTLATYGSASTGIDSPHWQVLIMATPRADVEQSVGRVLRQGSPVVIEIVDTASIMMKRMALKKYERFYKGIAEKVVGREVLVR